MSTTNKPIPDSCDYLIVGGGATGLAFADSLLRGNGAVSVVVVDKHEKPGGQWNDSYAFVQLHQPSASYGVESIGMEPKEGDQEHRATREEVLEYYGKVQQQLSQDFDIYFVGGATLDLFQQATDNAYTFTIQASGFYGGATHSIQVTRRLVDARYLEPDLPITVKPKFEFDQQKIECLSVNFLTTFVPSTPSSSAQHYYVVIGAGKTGMDAVYYLMTTLKVDPSNIVWVLPHDPWITARESIGNCMEFLHDAACQQEMDLQTTFQQWEQDGKIYRLVEEGEPTKFKDATLSKDELEILRQIPATNLIRGKGRVERIEDDGTLILENGSVKPFDASDTTYVHCSAGAFNYTRQVGTQPHPVFDAHRITCQDVYGTPGFCFVGSILGKLESIEALTDDQRNALCGAPGPSQKPTTKLGFTSGDVGTLDKDHGYIQRLRNLKGWLQIPELRTWLVGHRLFNLGHYNNAEDMDKLVEETWVALQEKGLVD